MLKARTDPTRLAGNDSEGGPVRPLQRPGYMPSRPSGELPFFSVVIPTYGRPRQLMACLEALTRIEYRRDRFDVLVVDDGSPLPLDGVIARFGEQLNLRLIRQEHAGPARARNAGASSMRGRFLAFIDDDCTPAPDWLQSLALRFARTPDNGIGGRTVNAIPGNLWSGASQMLIDYLYGYYNAASGKSPFFAANNLALPADRFQAIGGFDTTFSGAGGEDRELCDRWLHHGWRVTYAPEAIVTHAHVLNLLTFWRQHVHYGVGALRYHRIRGLRGWGRIKLEGTRFYLNLVRFPFSQARGWRAFALSGLLLLSQVANASGFFWMGMKEFLAEPRRRRGRT